MFKYEFCEPMTDMFSKSSLVILDFDQIPSTLQDEASIKRFFEECERAGLDPKSPAYRQEFNDRLLQTLGSRYLVGRYGEDRSAMLADSEIARQGRTIHLGIDVFSNALESVYSPCDGEIVRADREETSRGYGNYIIIKPSKSEGLYVFLGHLSADLPKPGPVKSGKKIARLGDYVNNENGGWSRHLHIQLLTGLPEDGRTPDGYATQENFAREDSPYIDPMPFFSGWQVDNSSEGHIGYNN